MNNYFELFDLQISYDIDLKILEKQYFIMQAKYHPDKITNVVNSVEKEKNLLITMELNNAYSTLKDDLKRAEYILSLNGINLNDPKIRNQLSSKELDILWAEMETIETTQELTVLEKINKRYKLIYNNEIINLAKVFMQQNLLEVSIITSRLKYIKTLLNNLQEKIKLCK